MKKKHMIAFSMIKNGERYNFVIYTQVEAQVERQ